MPQQRIPKHVYQQKEHTRRMQQIIALENAMYRMRRVKKQKNTVRHMYGKVNRIRAQQGMPPFFFGCEAS